MLHYHRTSIGAVWGSMVIFKAVKHKEESRFGLADIYCDKESN